MPLAIARAKYTFSKNSDGKIIVDYEWTSELAPESRIP
jgi:hypothetical protein